MAQRQRRKSHSPSQTFTTPGDSNPVPVSDEEPVGEPAELTEPAELGEPAELAEPPETGEPAEPAKLGEPAEPAAEPDTTSAEPVAPPAETPVETGAQPLPVQAVPDWTRFRGLLELIAIEGPSDPIPEEEPAGLEPLQRQPVKAAAQQSAPVSAPSSALRESSSLPRNRPVRQKEETMGSLTSDMTRLHENIKTLYGERRNLLDNILRTSDARKDMVAQMTATFRTSRMDMAQKGRQDRGAFLNGLKHSVDTLRNGLRSDLTEAGKVFRSAKR